MTTHTCFDGTLIRIGPDHWEWKDGSPAPQVVDLRLNSHNFRISGGFVLVPTGVIDRNPELEFCRSYPCPTYDPKHHHVPVAVWDAENDREPIGATWPLEIEPILIDRAQDLGWSWDGHRAKSITS